MIVGWLEEVPFGSPLNIRSLADMHVLNDAWLLSAAQWIQKSKEQVKAHTMDLEGHREDGEVVGKKRKK